MKKNNQPGEPQPEETPTLKEKLINEIKKVLGIEKGVSEALGNLKEGKDDKEEK